MNQLSIFFVAVVVGGGGAIVESIWSYNELALGLWISKRYTD